MRESMSIGSSSGVCASIRMCSCSGGGGGGGGGVSVAVVVAVGVVVFVVESIRKSGKGLSVSRCICEVEECAAQVYVCSLHPQGTLLLGRFAAMVLATALSVGAPPLWC